MTLKEFQERTDWMSPDTEIIVNFELIDTLEVYDLMTDQEDNMIVLMAKVEGENEKPERTT